MILRTRIEIALAVAIVASGVAGVRAWVTEHDLRVHAESVEATQKQLQAGYQKQVNDLAKAVADRDASYQRQVDVLTQKFQQAVTPEQVSRILTSAMQLKTPIQITALPPTPQSTTPTPIAAVAETDLPQMKVYVEACEECKLERDKLIGDANDRVAQAVLAQKQIESLKTERDTWKLTAKGGTLLQRVKKAAKWWAIGAAVGAGAGAVVVCQSGHCK